MESLDDISAAVVPLAGLRALAELRARRDVRVIIDGERAWVEWPAGDEVVLRRLLPVRGTEFYRKTDEGWRRLGSRMPASGVPIAGAAVSQVRVLTPAPVEPVPVDDRQWQPTRFRLVRMDRPRETTALSCRLGELAEWADRVPSARIAALTGARLGESVLLRGTKLPAVVGAMRFWGETVLLPLGWRLEPDLPAAAVREASGVSAHELLVWSDEGPEVIPIERFRPLSRAAIRLAEKRRAPEGMSTQLPG